MLSDDATFFVVLSWLYYRYWNADIENIRYPKLLVSCEYYDYCHFEHQFFENVKFGATKNCRDSRGSTRSDNKVSGLRFENREKGVQKK